MAVAAPHVLFLTESFHPVLGGGETHVRELSRRLAAAGWRASVLTRRGDESWPERERLDGVEVVRVPPAGPARIGKYRMVPRAIAELLRPAQRFDLLVVRGTRVLGLPGLLAGRVRGRPVVMQPEINGEVSGEAYVWGTPLARRPWREAIRVAVAARNLLLRDADAFVAMSRQIEAEMLEARMPREKVVLLPHGVDTLRFSPPAPAEREEARRRLGLPPQARLVVYSGRLLRGKGLETLLEAFARVAVRQPDARLVIVGSGEGQALSVEAELRERARQPPLLERVLFTGRVDDVAEHLRAAEIFAFPSVFEALGLSLIEAAASGMACVGARTGGIVDVIEHGRTGLLFEPGDAEGLAGCLEQLLDDAALRAALGARARERVKARFDVEASVERYGALFRELLARKGRPS